MGKNEKTIEKTKSFNAELTNGAAILHVIYGSRTGNSESAARLASDFAKHLGLATHLHDMKNLDPDKFRPMRNLLLAVSTHGEGDPPAVVEDFYNFLHSPDAPSMGNARFSILALGDSSYKDYCKTGHDFRKRFLELGAKEIYPIAECDINYEENAKEWVRNTVNEFEKLLPKSAPVEDKEFAFELDKGDVQNKNVFFAKVLEKKLLTNPSFAKKTFHLSLSMDGFNKPYYPGDSFAIYTQNSRLFTDKLLKTLNYDGTHTVVSGETNKLLKQALIDDFETTLITPLVVEKYADLTKNAELIRLLQDTQKLEKYCNTADLLDLITDYPARIKPQEFISMLRPLAPRLYSVANSTMVYPGEVHFTAGLMEYKLNKRLHRGVCSTFIEDRISVGSSVPVQLEENTKFRLPGDDNIPVIMIATGTGIAPFRGFLQQREQTNAPGENWLFFGDRHKESDYLYRKEIEYYFKNGLLTRLNTAFSRDQKEKVYVHHHMLEQGKEIYHWLTQKGAILYVCGNKRTMGISVKDAIERICVKEGNLSTQSAQEFIDTLKLEKRFLTDLY